jgi:hypothetical protein
VLLDSDIEYLEAKGWSYTSHENERPPLLVIHDYKLPPGFSHERVELLIEIPESYPDAKLDMFWIFPIVTLANGAAPPQSQERRQFDNKLWQRFSRHLNNWRPESDSLQTYLVWIHNHLVHDAGAAA